MKKYIENRMKLLISLIICVLFIVPSITSANLSELKVNSDIGMTTPLVDVDEKESNSEDDGIILPSLGPAPLGNDNDWNYWTNPPNMFSNVTGNIGIGTKSPLAKLHVYGGSVLFDGSTGGVPASTKKTKFMWIPSLSALRAGYVTGNQWTSANIGKYSVAMGYNTRASGESSTAMGNSTTSSGLVSTAIGYYTTASGSYSTAIGTSSIANGTSSTAMGYGTTASGPYSTAIGLATIANGSFATAIGFLTKASGTDSTAMGYGTTASGPYSTAIGSHTTANGPYSTTMGSNTIASGYFSTAIGYQTNASGTASTAMGYYSKAINSYATAMGDHTTASGHISTAMGTGTIAGGFYTTAIGSTITVNGDNSVGIGLNYNNPNWEVNSDNVMSIMGGKVGINELNPQYTLDVQGAVQAWGYYTGDIIFQKDGKQLWRIYEDEKGLYAQNLITGKTYKFVLQNTNTNEPDLNQVIKDLQQENQKLEIQNQLLAQRLEVVEQTLGIE